MSPRLLEMKSTCSSQVTRATPSRDVLGKQAGLRVCPALSQAGCAQGRISLQKQSDCFYSVYFLRGYSVMYARETRGRRKDPLCPIQPQVILPQEPLCDEEKIEDNSVRFHGAFCLKPWKRTRQAEWEAARSFPILGVLQSITPEACSLHYAPGGTRWTLKHRCQCAARVHLLRGSVSGQQDSTL